MEQLRLNAYHIMWLFVYFDLPTSTKKERRAASQFRKKLLQDGFTMMQFSVYTRHCASKESLDVHVKRVESFIPEFGSVSLLRITDKQYGDMINFIGVSKQESKNQPLQLELF